MKQQTGIKPFPVTPGKPVRKFAPYNRSSKALAPRRAEQDAIMDQHLSPLCKAVDEFGKGVIVVTTDGKILLATNRAKQWTKIYFGPLSVRARKLPKAVDQWVRNQKTPIQKNHQVYLSPEPLVIARGAKRLVVRLLPDPHHSVLLLEEHGGSVPAECIECLGLTPREAEVLDWVAKGKTSAEIGMILGRSGRTVSKHLERIYRKLGVENRTAAAMRCLDIVSHQRPKESSQ